jgi:predicted DNA-binding transcriptional regulator YafY
MNNSNETSNRQVEPIGLIFYALNWHLIAWCHHRNDYRDFRVGRILRLKSAGLPFKKDKHIELGDYMKLLPVNY